MNDANNELETFIRNQRVAYWSRMPAAWSLECKLKNLGQYEVRLRAAWAEMLGTDDDEGQMSLNFGGDQ